MDNTLSSDLDRYDNQTDIAICGDGTRRIARLVDIKFSEEIHQLYDFSVLDIPNDEFDEGDFLLLTDNANTPFNSDLLDLILDGFDPASDYIAECKKKYGAKVSAAWYDMETGRRLMTINNPELMPTAD